MQFWPRVRAKRPFARVRAHNESAVEKGPVGFAGYKAGMTHVTIIDNRKNSLTNAEEIAVPVTIIEVPDLFVYGVRSYAHTEDGLRSLSEKVVKAPKELRRRGPFAKKAVGEIAQGAELIRLLVSTKPHETGTSQKTPNVFELALAGSLDDQKAYAEEVLGKNISIKDVIKALDLVDVHGITKGKGFQGPVKRFGVSLRSHKSEKGQRGPANVGAWTGNRSYRVAHAGQMGYHQRLDLTKQVLAIIDAESVQIDGGIPGYGQPKSTVMLVTGSVPGTRRRLIRFTPAVRDMKTKFTAEPEIVEIATRSQQ
jgi:large subunit ribosomal protein L3